MKKRFLMLLPAIPAIAFALPQLDSFLELYRERRQTLAELTMPAAYSPDNVIRRYAVFRASMFKDMAEFKADAIPFAWGEPIFFLHDDFITEGDGEWLAEGLEEAKTLVAAGSNSVPVYALWVGESIDDEGARKWVLAVRDTQNGHAVGDILYEVDVDCINPDYAPHAMANAVLRAARIEPTRGDFCEWYDDTEGMFMRLIYNTLDPARFRMAVNLMDFNDYLLLKTPGLGSEEPGGNGPGGGDPVLVARTVNVVEPAQGAVSSFYFATNNVLNTSDNGGSYSDTYVFSNKNPFAISSNFTVTNNSNSAMNLTWTGRPSRNLPAGANFTTNLVAQAGDEIRVTISIPETPAVASAPYRFYWNFIPPRTGEVEMPADGEIHGFSWINDAGMLSTSASGFSYSDTYRFQNTTAVSFDTFFEVENKAGRSFTLSWKANEIEVGCQTIPAGGTVGTNMTVHAGVNAKVTVEIPAGSNTASAPYTFWWGFFPH